MDSLTIEQYSAKELGMKIFLVASVDVLSLQKNLSRVEALKRKRLQRVIIKIVIVKLHTQASRGCNLFGYDWTC